MDYQTILADDTAKITDAIRQMDENNFGFELKLQKSLDSSMSKAYAKQDELLMNLTQKIRGLEDEADQALTNEQVNM